MASRKLTTPIGPPSPTRPKQPRLFKPSETEVEAYTFIRKQLADLGWNTRNPSLNTGGQVWTQNQCLSHPGIKGAFDTKRPENVIKLSEQKLWIIEAKANKSDIRTAVEESIQYYAARINQGCEHFDAVIATGVAGNDGSGYTVQTFIFARGTWQRVTINGKEATGFLSPDDARFLVENQVTDVHEYAPPPRLFLQSAERINAILHNGGINKNDRAKTMAALLLAVIDSPPDVDRELRILINDINTRSEFVLRQNGKPDFAPFVKILPPTNQRNHVKFKAALVNTIQELQNLNIRSAMNSSTDVLGQFYEVFLKYGNGAKEIGIVLTPRHITRFAVEAIGITHRDIVLDPACGTGGFLVAAFDHVRQIATPAQLELFKEHNLFGIEQESHIAILAIVNMIFRGDGKHNITEGNAFTTHLTKKSVNGHPSAAFRDEPCKDGEEPVTRVLMNPPFALNTSPEKEHRFVSRALALMEANGILFCLVPMDTMFGAHDEKIWRRDDLLASNTLLAVVSLPSELFYPSAMKQVVGVIIKKGVPHPRRQAVFWGRIARDGHIKIKSRRLEASDVIPPRVEPNDIGALLPHLRSFMADPSYSINIPLLCKTIPVDYGDPLLELMPEAYIDSPLPTVAEISRAIDRMARENAAFLIRAGVQGPEA